MQDPKRCRNCDLVTIRTTKLVAVTPSGRQLHLHVCRECFLHLGGRKAPRPILRPSRD